MGNILEEMAVLVLEDLLPDCKETITDSACEATPAQWKSVVPVTPSCERVNDVRWSRSWSLVTQDVFPASECCMETLQT